MTWCWLVLRLCTADERHICKHTLAESAVAQAHTCMNVFTAALRCGTALRSSAAVQGEVAYAHVIDSLCLTCVPPPLRHHKQAP